LNAAAKFAHAWPSGRLKAFGAPGKLSTKLSGSSPDLQQQQGRSCGSLFHSKKTSLEGFFSYDTTQ